MRVFAPVLFTTLMLANACAGEGSEASVELTEASPSALEAADRGDKGDRQCQVVLRSTLRPFTGSGYETDCSSGTCLYLWRGGVDVDSDLAEGASVHVLYRMASDSSWWTIEAQRAPAEKAGFERFSFAISDHLFGPESSGEAGIELVPFLVLPDGRRLFDHNRFAGDNHRLLSDNGFRAGDDGVCQPTVGSLYFYDGWRQGTHGMLREGGYLEVNYDSDRLPECRATHNGQPAWDTVAHLRFSPGGRAILRFGPTLRWHGWANGAARPLHRPGARGSGLCRALV